MWIAVKVALIRVIALIGRGVVGWFVLLGKYPSLSRDPGIVAWHGRPERRTRRPREGQPAELGDSAECELPAGELKKLTLVRPDSLKPLRAPGPPARRLARSRAPRSGPARFHHRRPPVEMTSRFFR